MILAEKTEVLGGKPVPLPLFPPQIPHRPQQSLKLPFLE